jgi:serralysin
MNGTTGSNELTGGDGDDHYTVNSQTTYILDSGGTDSALVTANFVKLPRSIENVTYASGVQALPYWIDGLLPDDANGLHYATLLGSAKTMTFSFPRSLPSYDTGAGDGVGFTAFTETQKTYARQALAYINTLIDVRFVEVGSSDAPNNISFANNYQQDSAAYAFYPSTVFIGSDVFLDGSGWKNPNLNPADGTYAALTLIHEIGHALGLKHPFSQIDTIGETGEAPFLIGADDDTAWTVMSYTSHPAQYHLQYSPFDIAALQYMYGPSVTTRPGNDTHTLNGAAATLLFDGGGLDTLDASAQTQNVTLYLEPGYWGFIGSQANTLTAPGQVTINFGTAIEDLIGGAGNDTLTGNGLNNAIAGRGGNDRLDGAGGIDTAVFVGNRSNFALEVKGSSYIVRATTGSEGEDTLVNIERLKFSDVSLALDMGGNAGLTAKTLGAVFGKASVANKVYAGIGLALLDAGMSDGALMQFALNARLGAQTDHASVVTLLYSNVVGTAPGSADLAWYQGWLDSGAYTPASLGLFAAETPLNQANINLVGLAATGLEFA